MERSRGMCVIREPVKEIITPVIFTGDIEADTPSEIDLLDVGTLMEGWSKKIRSNDGSMDIPHPDSVPCTVVSSNIGIADNTIGTEVTSSGVSVIPAVDEFDRFTYQSQIAKKRADIEADLVKDKIRENTVLSHSFSNYGYLREKTFVDGVRMSHVVANGNIVNVCRWLVGENEYASLLIEDTTPGIRDRKTEWTSVFNVNELNKDTYIEQLLSRYFKPSDSRAYSPISIKEFRSRISEAICSVEPEIIPIKTGWYISGDRRLYYDGSNYPIGKHILGRMRRVNAATSFRLENTIRGLCEELNSYDSWNRLAFLIGYGMITWLSAVFSLEWNKHPGVLIFGNEEACRRYADACLKMYRRADGSDIVSLSENNKKTLLEYADVLRDDAFVLNCHHIGWNSSLVKTIISGRSIDNHGLEAPIVVLQSFPDQALNYDDYVTVNLNGYKISDDFCLYMQELKTALLAMVENNLRVSSETMNRSSVSYEKVASIVFPGIKQYLFSAGVTMSVLDTFFDKLEKGMVIKKKFSGDIGDTFVHLFKQGLEQAIESGKLSVTGDIRIRATGDPKRSIIVRNNSVYVPAKYLNEKILPSLNLSIGDFNKIRGALIERDLLDTYNTEKGYTKKITVSRDDRIHVYDMDKSVFITFEKFGL